MLWLGNTIGTVVANAVLLALFGQEKGTGEANAAFNSLRILEDVHYQAALRQTLKSYVNQVTNTDENTSFLTPDLEFYERYVLKVLSARYEDIMKAYHLSGSLKTGYFPWNRTFEIGFTLSDTPHR